jgi:hypothetical protein
VATAGIGAAAGAGPSLLASKASRFNCMSPSTSAQLAKEHGDELSPTTETPGMSLGAVLTHGRFKFKARD